MYYLQAINSDSFQLFFRCGSCITSTNMTMLQPIVQVYTDIFNYFFENLTIWGKVLRNQSAKTKNIQSWKGFGRTVRNRFIWKITGPAAYHYFKQEASTNISVCNTDNYRSLLNSNYTCLIHLLQSIASYNCY